MLKRYLYRLYDFIISRGNIEIESLSFDDYSGKRGSIEGQLRFYDQSLLDFDEVVVLRLQQIIKLRYAYHYQNSEGELIFRYDNAPHHPDVSTYPHHKHVGSKNKIEATQEPNLEQILQEIEQQIYNGS